MTGRILVLMLWCMSSFSCHQSAIEVTHVKGAADASFPLVEGDTLKKQQLIVKVGEAPKTTAQFDYAGHLEFLTSDVFDQQHTIDTPTGKEYVIVIDGVEGQWTKGR